MEMPLPESFNCILDNGRDDIVFIRVSMEMDVELEVDSTL